MISLSYVNGVEANLPQFDPLIKLESEFDEIIDSLDAVFNEYNNAVYDNELYKEFMEAEDKEKSEKIEKANKNIIDKIGQAVIDVTKKAIAFIQNIINKLKDISINNKINTNKLDKAIAILEKNPDLIKNNPSIKDKIMDAYASGNLKPADLKGLAELDKTFEEIMHMSKKADIDPKTLRGKWELAKEKAANIDKATVVKVAAVTTTALIALKTIKNYHSDTLVAQKNAQEASKTLSEYKDFIYQQCEKEGMLDNKGALQQLLVIHRELCGKHCAACNESLTVAQRLANVGAKLGDLVIDAANKASNAVSKSDLGLSTSQMKKDVSHREDLRDAQRAIELNRKINEAKAIEKAKLSVRPAPPQPTNNRKNSNTNSNNKNKKNSAGAKVANQILNRYKKGGRK